MIRLRFWDVLQVVGALASIVGLIGLLRSRPGLSIALSLLVVAGVIAVIIASILARHTPQAIGRDAMIQTGRRLIKGVKTEAVMFGGDMSWAADYEEAIRTVTNGGKRVRVLYPQHDAVRVHRNAQILLDAGAQLLATAVDSGLRALLLDPQDPKDALLYVATRTLRTGRVPVEVGDHGSEQTYKYVARVYTMDRDWVLIQAATKIRDVLTPAQRA